MANILLLGVQIPFVRGGQDVLIRSLREALQERGHLVDTVELPYSGEPKESLPHQCAQWRSLDLSSFGGRSVDLVIPTKFPSYYASHPKKSLWLVHQHRELYDLYGSRYCAISDDPRDESLRRMLVDGDRTVIGECAYVSGISKNVINRLADYNGVTGEVLYPPLTRTERYRCEPVTAASDKYILSVGRICGIKRVDMMIKALPIIHQECTLKIVGAPDEPQIMEYLNNEIDKHHLWDRVTFVGRAGEDELIELYANALGIYYAPHNEDYGYVTLEAMASGKPVITASDSGGVLEFITDGVQGLVAEPNSDSIGHAVNRLVEDLAFAEALGQNGRTSVEGTAIFSGGWDHIVDRLLSPLKTSSGVGLSEGHRSKRVVGGAG